MSAASDRGAKGVLTITLISATGLLPMDTVTGQADPYLIITVESISQRSPVRMRTLEPVYNQTMQFNAMGGRSVVRGEMYDHEAMGSDRLMGTFKFVVPSDSLPHLMSHKLVGALPNGRTTQGSVNSSFSFARGASRVVKDQKSEFDLFCETENYKDFLKFWIFPSRRMEHAFFKKPLHVHEHEFTKAVGTLSVPLTGLAIKQYLTYVLVEHSHQVDVYSCREFCGFFKRKLNNETSIMYRDIVKLVKERNTGVKYIFSNVSKLKLEVCNNQRLDTLLKDFCVQLQRFVHWHCAQPAAQLACRMGHACAFGFPISLDHVSHTNWLQYFVHYDVTSCAFNRFAG